MCGKCSIQHFFSSPGGPLSLSSSLENRGFLCFNAAMWISRKVLSVKRGIKKWSAVFRIGLIQGLAFRAETFLWIILDIFPTFILIASWLAVFHGKTTVGGQSLSQLNASTQKQSLSTRILFIHSFVPSSSASEILGSIISVCLK